MKPKVALVTGAVGNIGPGICEALTEAGWLVVGHTRTIEDWAQYERIVGRPFSVTQRLQGDLCTREECHRIVCEAKALGPIRLLINNAAINPTPVPAWEEITEEYLQQVLAVDLLAPLFLAQACLSDFKSSAHGATIINIGSVLSVLPPRGQIFYPIAKASLENLTQIMARDFASFGIRSNLIRVGSVPGPAFMWKTLCELPTEQAQRLYREMLPRQQREKAHLNPTGTTISPRMVGDLAVFLASDSATQITGAIIPLDGALSSVPPLPAKSTPWEPIAEVERWLQENQIKSSPINGPKIQT